MTVAGGLQPGTRIGSYEVGERLGSGGMGVVYRARDVRLGRTVALKVLRPDADPGLLHRLDREARAASALNHPGIVHIYDVGEAADQGAAHFVVMEYVEGETLRRHLGGGALPLSRVLDLGGQLALGLSTAHQAGVVHRDLKPENLMVTPEGTLKILDFGLAKIVPPPLADLDARETASRHSTQPGMLVGTLEYMAPEQATGQAIDTRTDQFAFGLILYEMAAGRTPFRRETAAQVLAAILEREPEPLARLRADIPPALDALVTRCLQKDPAHRFPTTGELVRQLQAISVAPAAVVAMAPVAPQPVPVLLPPAAPSGRYHVQIGRKVRVYEEDKLVDSIRRGKLTGLELARPDGAEGWEPLHESRIYRREVPVGGDPVGVARWRALRGLGGHLTGFAITGLVMFNLEGHFPFWMAFWGIGLASHALRALPLFFVRHGPTVGPADPPPALPAPPAAASPLADEAQRVRDLIAQRGGDDVPRLMAEVDGIVRLTGELAAREGDLAEQTSEGEQASLARAEAEARARLERAESATDRRLFERQLEVVHGRQDGIAKALRVLDRLRVRREMAGHQLKQLRLDLSRGAAGGLDAPELSSRLEFIRHEVDAAEDVEEMLADRR